jgi:RHS repeat-associated protein
VEEIKAADTTHVGKGGYRYGFNGKEKSNEIYGEGNAYNFGARIQDPRLGRWLSTDPLQQKYADLSPYNYCANSPISAKDPDGKVIIFINGLYTPGTSIGQPLEPYWTSYDGKNNWIKQAQDRIGDHAQPRFYDGSLGGTAALLLYKGATNKVNFRENEGKDVGYKDAPTIIKNLSKGETIKIVTNSMGTAFAHGFTKGILQYQSEENERRSDFNSSIDAQILLLYIQRGNLASQLDKVPIPQTTDNNKQIYKSMASINSKINELNAQKKELLNVQFESETDLSSHQVDNANPDVKNSYYMTTNNFSPFEKIFVNQKAIKGAINLGTMDVHHSSGANPANLPPSTTPDPNPQKK